MSVVYVDYCPRWDDEMFGGMGGFEGETALITYICSVEYQQILPDPDREYRVFPHRYCSSSGGSE